MTGKDTFLALESESESKSQPPATLTAESRHTSRRSATSAAARYELRAVAAGESAASPASATVVSYKLDTGLVRVRTSARETERVVQEVSCPLALGQWARVEAVREGHQC